LTEAAPVDGQANALVHSAMPFATTLGIEVLEASKDQIRARMAWDTRLCTSGEIMHGGALMAFADTLGGTCAFLNLPEGAGTTTIESKTNFFRAVKSGHVHATTKPLHVGRKVIVLETDLTDDAGKRVARVTQSQMVLSAE
jgi:1,4-dihydroxy-2-naphthoyl-CoA hydrolase